MITIGRAHFYSEECQLSSAHGLSNEAVTLQQALPIIFFIEGFMQTTGFSGTQELDSRTTAVCESWVDKSPVDYRTKNPPKTHSKHTNTAVQSTLGLCLLPTQASCKPRHSGNMIQRTTKASEVSHLLESIACPLSAVSQSVTKLECPVNVKVALRRSSSEHASKVATALRAPSSPAHT